MRWYKEIFYFAWHFGLHTMWDIVVSPRLIKKHTRSDGIMSFLGRLFKEEIESLSTIDAINDNDTLSNNKKIWLCWWQGKEEMPETIRKCVESIFHFHQDCDIVVLDKNNYSKYVKLPQVIIDKVEKKIISLSQLSDILRCSLLYEYGGIWLDSALFCTAHGEWNNMKFFSPKIRCDESSFISGFKWVPGCIGAISYFPLFGFAYDCFIKYWERHSFLVDFLLVDYVFELAYRNSKLLKDIIDSREYNNEGIHASRYLFNDKCDVQMYNELIKNNQFLSLTWRFPYRITDENGDLTYYGQLLKDFDKYDKT